MEFAHLSSLQLLRLAANILFKVCIKMFVCLIFKNKVSGLDVHLKTVFRRWK